MNAVGIDVSKGKSMVAIMRPFGEIVASPFEVKHTASDIKSLVKLIHSVKGESRIVMEHTGRYYEVLAHQLFYHMGNIKQNHLKLIQFYLPLQFQTLYYNSNVSQKYIFVNKYIKLLFFIKYKRCA